MAKYKALILYGSITGNTEAVAQAFAGVFEQYGFEPRLLKIRPGYDWDADPVFFEDYEFICLGSPIIAAMPYKEVNMVMGLQGKPVFFHHPDPDSKPGKKVRYDRTKYGVVFCTYGGNAGPRECIPALAVEKEYLAIQNVRVVGEFACCGKELRHESVDSVSRSFGINLDEAQELLQSFRDDPYDEKWKAAYEPGQLFMLANAAGVKDEDSFGAQKFMSANDPMGIGMPGSEFWHYNYLVRPHERDLQKARIFLSEILEDYFLTETGEPREPDGMYTCIG